MIEEAIVLVGGRGTRLAAVVADRPKPMAEVNGRPFLCYVLERLRRHGVRKAVLSIGYMHEAISSYFGDRFQDLALEYALESEPCGTGGGILKSLPLIEGDNVLALNGDTFFAADLKQLALFHEAHGPLTIALKSMEDFDRYGVVRIDEDNRVIRFEEKGYHERGFINGGIYAVDRKWLREREFPERFSWETDFLEQVYREVPIHGLPLDAPFIDIGNPEDYRRAGEVVEDQ